MRDNSVCGILGRSERLFSRSHMRDNSVCGILPFLEGTEGRELGAVRELVERRERERGIADNYPAQRTICRC
ncbi:hypothetical protein M513_13406 [Trichuris suis]|uniref:Uncharacterized protein n=1 Tax=Trichuris suis TaxID=68888 RepID=A0A085LL71_9BILA|nr:hypothetical protein M513_13406 [Trichuris suis]